MKRDFPAPDLQDILSSMLVDWHHYCHHTADRAGLPGRAAGFGQSRSNSQYDWENGLESDQVDRRIMQGFDAAADRVRDFDADMQMPRGPVLYTALQFEARNLAVRYQVWTSPRLPTDPREREALILEARNKLLRELDRDGVLQSD